MQFYNKLNAKEQSDLIDKSGKNRIVLSFYKYSVIGILKFSETIYT